MMVKRQDKTEKQRSKTAFGESGQTVLNKALWSHTILRD